MIAAASLAVGLYAQDTTAEKKFFIQGGLGIGLYPGSAETTITFPAYGEIGSLRETYGFKGGFSGNLSVGKYFQLGQAKVKAGVCFSLSSMKTKDEFQATVPHPFLSDSPRTMNFNEKRSCSLFSAYAFGLYPLISGETFRLYLGPALGIAKAKFHALEDFELEDKAPYAASDLSVTSTSFAAETLSGLTFGALINAEYSISPSMAIVFDGGIHSFGPHSKKLDVTVKYLRVQTMIGVLMKF